MTMTEIKPVNDIYSFSVQSGENIAVSYDSINDIFKYKNSENIAHWNIDIQYNQIDDYRIEGKIIFINKDNSDEKLEFIFNNESDHWRSASTLEKDEYHLHILKTDENQPNIDIYFSIIHDENLDIVNNFTINTGIDKITDNAHFIDYNNLKLNPEFIDYIANQYYGSNFTDENRLEMIEMIKHQFFDNSYLSFTFETDYINDHYHDLIDNWTPWH